MDGPQRGSESTTMQLLLVRFASDRDEASAERCGFGLNGVAVKPSRWRQHDRGSGK